MEIKQNGIGRDDRTHRIVKPLGPKHNPRAHANKTLKTDKKNTLLKDGDKPNWDWEKWPNTQDCQTIRPEAQSECSRQ